jgi:hypothetical protein
MFDATFDESGYVEEEFLVRGAADALDPDGRVLAADARYATRVLVRRPASPDAFSGTVVIEPFHNLGEGAPIWGVSGAWIVEKGHAWIGVTVHSGSFGAAFGRAPGGVPMLRAFDPVRYAELDLARFENPPPIRMQQGPAGFDPIEMRWRLAIAHPQGTGIVGAIGQTVKGGATGVLAGFEIARVYGCGASQTGQFWRLFVDRDGHDASRLPDGRPAFDAYAISVAPVPESRPADATIVNILSEGEVVGTLNPRMMCAPDDGENPRVRGYEIPGTPHAIRFRPDMASPPRDHDAVHTDCSFDLMVHAIMDNLDAWVRDGTPMPGGARITRDLSTLDGVARDEHGNALGGWRGPWLDAPRAQYLARCTCGPTVGEMIPFSDAEMARIYGSRDGYVKAWSRAVDDCVARHALTPRGAARLHAHPE